MAVPYKTKGSSGLLVRDDIAFSSAWHANLSGSPAPEGRLPGLQIRGDAEARRALLSSCILGALVHPGAAQLWASALEAAEGELESVEALTAAITSDCASIAGVLFASGLGL